MADILANIKSIKYGLAATMECEFDMLMKGNLKCSDRMLKARHWAMVMIFGAECLLSDGYNDNKEVINHMIQQAKEIENFILSKNC